MGHGQLRPPLGLTRLAAWRPPPAAVPDGLSEKQSNT